MAKGARRQREQAKAERRRARTKEQTGKSKYAQKRAQQLGGSFAPTSPFVSESHPDAHAEEHWTDARGYQRVGGGYVPREGADAR